MNMGAVDTVLCMGAAVSMAAGFDRTFRTYGEKATPVGATIGDSTFFHAGLPPLVNAVAHGASFLLLILDNGTTAMTGHQPTPALDRFETSGLGRPLSIEDAVHGCGVKFIRVGDPYRYDDFLDLLKEASAFTAQGQGPAVVIARHPCLMDRHQPRNETAKRYRVTEDCVGCGVCQEDFGCPAWVEGENGQMRIIEHLCVGCGICTHVCPADAVEEI
jgi:indolepyruvate ferredoxin oxidoreductase alpha subunit